MKKIKDKDLGISCDYVATGIDENTVIRKSLAHVHDQHPEVFEAITEKVRHKIRNHYF